MSTVVCQKLPPTTVTVFGSVTPIPRSPSCVSPPPVTTGVPAARPVCDAALLVTSPTGFPDSTTSGKTSGRRPQSSAASGDHCLRLRLNIAELEPIEGSVTYRPDRRKSIQSLIMPRCAMLLKSSGLFFFIHRRRGGAVIETQSPPSKNIFSASPFLIIQAASLAALESTFGQAQTSRPALSYRTIPSLMLLALTAFT
jgi:hypothetical protein